MSRPSRGVPLSLHNQLKRILRTYLPDAPAHLFAAVCCSLQFILVTSSRASDVIVHRRPATERARSMRHNPRFVKREQGDI